jgi:TetR/AcrR family transcriptional repressor of lmrAB and yxaGH operons
MTVNIVKRRSDAVAGEVRRKMIEGATQLLARRGLQATSFAEVLEHTGAPRGSVYHHFPAGKDQMVGEAVDLAGAFLVGLLDRRAGASAQAITEHFLAIWRGVLTQSACESGCAVLAVAVATDSPDLLNHAAEVFRLWRGRLAGLLEQGGLAKKDACRFAALLIASAEGAVVMSRAEQDIEPFETVARQLLARVRTLAQ